MSDCLDKSHDHDDADDVIHCLKGRVFKQDRIIIELRHKLQLARKQSGLTGEPLPVAELIALRAELERAREQVKVAKDALTDIVMTYEKPGSGCSHCIAGKAFDQLAALDAPAQEGKS